MPRLDVITIGRSSVDLYGEQVGGRLEDMASFRKYIGGSPTNMAAGTARLGLKSAVITRVGDEHMGRFIREQLIEEGVDISGVITDPQRLTALVLLGIRDESQFPLIFYRENCADMALCEADIDPDFIAQATCITATGTHLSHPKTEAAVLKALRVARTNGQRTALDIDYRPNLWGLAGHGDGEERFIESKSVTEKLQSTLPLFDLIVGTEEEFHIAGGSSDTIAALCAVRERTKAILVCKRGPMGASAFVGPIPDSLDDGKTGPGFPIEVFNVLGAGDGFMSGLLRGWLRDEPWETTLKWANACGALAVSRHGCAPAYPSWKELQWFLENGSSEHALRKDVLLEHIHWATNRRAMPEKLHVIRVQNKLSEDETTDLIEDAIARPAFGVIADWDENRSIFYRAAEKPIWLGRIAPSGHDDFSQWPLKHTVVCRSDSADISTLARTYRSARSHGLEIAFEAADNSFAAMEIIARAGIYPDWWLVSDNQTAKEIEEKARLLDPWVRGVMVCAKSVSNTN